MTSSTPKNSVNPTATRPYISPSIRPLTRYWPNSAMSTGGGLLSLLRVAASTAQPLPACRERLESALDPRGFRVRVLLRDSEPWEAPPHPDPLSRSWIYPTSANLYC